MITEINSIEEMCDLMCDNRVPTRKKEMTNEEAIKILKSKMDGSVDTSYEWAEAVRMAIEALKVSKNPTGSKGGDAEMGDPLTPNPYMQHSPDSGADLISRQDAVNEIHKYFVEEIDKTPTEIDEDGFEFFTDTPTVNSLLACNKELSKRIKSLPSATCDDCIWHVCNYNKIDWDGEDGYISRQDALKPFCIAPDGTRIPEVDCDNFPVEFSVEFIKKHLLSLPSAEPEEVIPHRNYKYLSDYWCECGWHLGKKGEVKYCAECGRKVNWDG